MVDLHRGFSITELRAHLGLQINFTHLGSSTPVQKLATPTPPDHLTGKAEDDG